MGELPEEDWPTSEVKGYVEGSIKKSEMPNTQIYLLNELLGQFYDCYKHALMGCEYFSEDSDLHLSNEEFTKIMVTSFAIRNRQPQTQAKLQRKMESELLKNELLKKFKTDQDFPEAPVIALPRPHIHSPLLNKPTTFRPLIPIGAKLSNSSGSLGSSPSNNNVNQLVTRYVENERPSFPVNSGALGVIGSVAQLIIKQEQEKK